MRFVTSAHVTLKKRLRNISTLTRIAEEAGYREPESGVSVLEVSIRNEATIKEKIPV